MIDNLVKRAKSAAENAFVPLSNYAVGAALLAESGEVYIGSSVECSAASAGCCAERAALYSGIAHGDTSFVALAVFHEGTSLPYPCGTCVEALAEFSDDLEIVLVSEADIIVTDLKKLMPYPMSWERLEDRE